MSTELDPPGQDLSQLWSDCYANLKALARNRLRLSSGFTLLDPTGLVHQSYLRLIEAGTTGINAGTRAQFFAYASRVMRSVIVDLARERSSQKRGSGEVLRLNTRIIEGAIVDDDDPLFVSDALDTLRLREPRLAQVVEMRFFGGLTEVEIAELLGVSERTVRADWQKARVLMRMLLS